MEARTTNLRLLAAGLLGGLGVSMGAFGSHAFLEHMDVAQHRQYNVANQYHLLHAVAMMVVSVAAQTSKSAGNAKAADLYSKAYALFLAGTAMVTISRYVHCVLHKPDWLAKVAPVGGVVLTLGWGCVAAAAYA